MPRTIVEAPCVRRLAVLAAVGLALPAAAQQQFGQQQDSWSQQQRQQHQQDPWGQQQQHQHQFGGQLQQRIQQLGQTGTWQSPQSPDQRQQAQIIFQEAMQLSQQTGQQGRALPMGWIITSYDIDGDARYDAHELLHVSELDRARYTTRQRKQQCGVQTMNEVGPLSPIVRQVAQQQEQQQFGGFQQTGMSQQPRELQQLGQQAQQIKRQIPQEAQQLQQQYDQRATGLPSGWVLVSYDLVGDGDYNLHELIHLADLDEARFNSRMRKEQQGVQVRRQLGPFDTGPATAFQTGGMDRQHQYQQYQQQQQLGMFDQQLPQLQQVRGEIQKIDTVRVSGAREEHLLAEIKTEAGHKAHVDLGTRQDTRQLQLKEGAKVSVIGLPGVVDERFVLMACQVESDGRRAQIKLPDSMIERQIQAEVLNTQTASIEGADEELMIAQVRMSDGRRTLVDLGPKDKLRDANIRQGARLSLVATPGVIDGQQALLAKRVQTDGGRVVQIDRIDRIDLNTPDRRTATVFEQWENDN